MNDKSPFASTINLVGCMMGLTALYNIGLDVVSGDKVMMTESDAAWLLILAGSVYTVIRRSFFPQKNIRFKKKNETV